MIKKLLALIIPSLLIGGGCSAATNLLLSGKATEIKSEISSNEIVVKNIDFDYIVTGASEDQILSFKDSDLVENVNPYVEISFSVRKDEVYNLDVKHAKEGTKNTEFCDERIVEQSNDVENSIYLDYSFAKRYGYSLNSEIKLASFAFKVTRIYQTYNLSAAFAPNLDKIISESSVNLIYKDVYIDCVDEEVNEFYNSYLQNYVPLAELLPQTTETDEEYQKYLDEFYARDFSTRIHTQKANHADLNAQNLKLSETYNLYNVLSGVIPAIILFLTALLMILIPIKKVKRECVDNGRKSVYLRYFLSNFVMLAVFIAISCILAFVIPGNIYFITLMASINGLVPSLIGAGVAFVLSQITTFLLVRGFNEK